MFSLLQAGSARLASAPGTSAAPGLAGAAAKAAEQAASDRDGAVASDARSPRPLAALARRRALEAYQTVTRSCGIIIGHARISVALATLLICLTFVCISLCCAWAGPFRDAERPAEDLLLPAPLCPTLVLHAAEARVAVPLAELSHARAGTTLRLRSPPDLPVLSIAIAGESGRHRLRLTAATRDCKDCSALRASPGGDILVCGVHDQPHGKIEAGGAGIHLVSVEDQTVLVVESDSSKLQYSLAHPGGKLAATAKVSSKEIGQEELEIHVSPGEDLALVVVVVLSLAVFTTSHSADKNSDASFPPPALPFFQGSSS